MSIANIIFLILLILLLIWVLNRLFFRTNIIYDKILKAGDENNSENNNTIDNADFLENSTSNFMISVWFFVDSWGKEISNEKNILFMGTDKSNTIPDELSNPQIGISNRECVLSSSNDYKNLSISLDKYENNLFIDIETYDDGTSTTDTQNHCVQKCPFGHYESDNSTCTKCRTCACGESPQSFMDKTC